MTSFEDSDFSSFVSIAHSKPGFLDRLSTAIDDVQLNIDVFAKRGLASYANNVKRTASQCNTLFSTSHPVSIEDLYVGTEFEDVKGDHITDEIVMDELIGSLSVSIVGIAGSGKSFFLKKAFLNRLKNTRDVFPVFIELKHIRRSMGNTIEDIIASYLTSRHDFLNEPYIKKLFSYNLILLFFDAYDEIDYSIRPWFEEQLRLFSSRRPESKFVITTRPDDTFTTLSVDKQLSVQGMPKESATALARKIPYPVDEVKDSFIVALEDNLYENHTSFASNPLLLSMMMLTFHEFGKIPGKMHLFYDKAFQALFYKHDLLKDKYRRSLESELEIDDISNVVKYISFHLFSQEKFSFSRDDLFVSLDNALKIFELDAEKSALFRDLETGICLLIQDGLEYVFVHRSFQEYFSARFLLENRDIIPELNRDVLIRCSTDQVFDIVYNMNASAIEEGILLPMLKEYISEYEELTDNKSRHMLFRKYVGSFLLNYDTKDVFILSNIENKQGLALLIILSIHTVKLKEYEDWRMKIVSKKAAGVILDYYEHERHTYDNSNGRTVLAPVSVVSIKKSGSPVAIQEFEMLDGDECLLALRNDFRILLDSINARRNIRRQF